MEKKITFYLCKLIWRNVLPNRYHITKVKSVLPKKHNRRHSSSQAMQCAAIQGSG